MKQHKRIRIFTHWADFIGETYEQELERYESFKITKTQVFDTIHLNYFLSTNRIFREEVDAIILVRDGYDVEFTYNKEKGNIRVQYYVEDILLGEDTVRIAHNLTKMYLGKYFNLSGEILKNYEAIMRTKGPQEV